jgi:predicted metalloprotease with PDZ domain
MQYVKWFIVALVVALAIPVIAGEKGKCTMDTQSCLDAYVTKLEQRGWVGIEMDKSSEAKGLVITRVVPGSPAEAAGLEADDLLLAVNGVKFADNTEDHCATCEATKDGWTPGSEVQYVVARNGEKMKVDVTLGQIPPDVMAQWVGHHMLQHATVAVAQN